MTKHTVHVIVSFSVEVDGDELKKEFGRVTKKMILEHALNNYSVDDCFDAHAKLIESYDTIAVRPIKKGIGSY